MECLVFARKMSSIVLNRPLNLKKSDRTNKKFSIQETQEHNISRIAEKIDELRKSCWVNLGVSRTKKNMVQFINLIQNDIKTLERSPLLNSLERIEIDQKIKLNEPNRRELNILLDFHNRQITTLLLLKACLFREESRGGHYRDDFPKKDENWQCHTTQKLGQEIKKRFIRN